MENGNSVPVARDEFYSGGKKRGVVKKMGSSKRKLMFILLFLHTISLLSILFQLQGIIFLYSAYVKLQTDILVITSMRKKQDILRKMKLVRAKRLYRKNRSCWFRVGRTK